MDLNQQTNFNHIVWTRTIHKTKDEYQHLSNEKKKGNKKQAICHEKTKRNKTKTNTLKKEEKYD